VRFTRSARAHLRNARFVRLTLVAGATRQPSSCAGSDIACRPPRGARGGRDAVRVSGEGWWGRGVCSYTEVVYRMNNGLLQNRKLVIALAVVVVIAVALILLVVLGGSGGGGGGGGGY